MPVEASTPVHAARDAAAIAAVRSLGRSAERPVPAGPPGPVPRPPFAWKTRVLLPAVLLAGFAAALGFTARDALWPATPVKVVPVMLAPAAGGAGGSEAAGTVTVQAPGWVEPDPFPIAVPALADGFVKEVLALEGQPVAKGQVVARLIDDDAKLALARAEAELAGRSAALLAAQDAWDNPVERTRAVATAAGKAGETKAELRMLEAEVSAAAAKAEELRYESQRAQKAADERAGSPLEAVTAKQRLVAAEATLEATRRKQAVLQQQLVQAEAELTAATANARLRIEEAGALAGAKAAADLARAAREEARLRLDRMEVRSPAAGVVMARMVEPGSKLFLSMDHPMSCVVVRLYDPARLQVRVDVPLADAAKVGVGQDAHVTVSKLPDRVFRGRVTRVVGEADVQKNTQQFKVAILDPAPELGPEMLARAKFLAPTTTRPTGGGGGGAKTAVFAPASLLARQGESAEAIAWTVDTKRNAAVRRTVRLGTATRGGWVAVTAGLSPGDALIAEPAGLSDGQKVRIEGEAAVPDSAFSIPPSALPTSKEAAHGVH